MWICFVIVLGVTTLLTRATRGSARTGSTAAPALSQPGCVVVRSHCTPAGTRRPIGRRQRAHSPAGR